MSQDQPGPSVMAGERIPGPEGIYPITHDSGAAIPGPSGLRDDWVEQEKLKHELAKDIGQLVLDIAGIVDPTPISDGTNALISLARGRWRDALISAVSIIPYIGDVSKIGKLGRYSISIRQAIQLARMDREWGVHLRRLFIKLKKPIDELLEVGADKLPERPLRYLQQMRHEIDRFLGPQRALRTPASKSPGVPQGGADPGKIGPGSKKPKKEEGSEKANGTLRSKKKTDTSGGAKSKTASAPRDRLSELSPAELEHIKNVDTFEPLGVSRQDAEQFLTSTKEGRQMLRQVSESAAPGTNPKVILDRALGYIQSGAAKPELQKINSPLVKVVPKGQDLSDYSPYFTTMDHLKGAQGSGKPLSDSFGLPAISDSAKYDVYQINPKGNATVYESTIAPTQELGGKFVTEGGARQIVVPNRNEFSPAEFLFSIDDN